jgi:glycosyltransferase involved in cell wall biosynthesis
MRCLLISPMRGADPLNGDVVYTEQLLAHPPAGVAYMDYLTAQREKNLSVQYKLRHYLQDLRAGRPEPLRNWIPALGYKGLSQMRRYAKGKLMLHEDWRLMHVSGCFDLIHLHIFPVRLQKPHAPIVLSDSYGNFFYLRDGLKWSERDIKRVYRFEGWLISQFRIYHTTLNMQDAEQLIIWSAIAKPFYLRRGIPPERISVIPPGLANSRKARIEHGNDINIGFIANHALSKGGDVLIAAFQELHRRIPETRLMIIGGDPRDSGLPLPEGAIYMGFMSQADILEKILPALDIYAFPSVFYYSISLLEAMSQGLPLIVSDRIIPEDGIVEEGVNGFTIPTGDIAAMVEKLEILCRDKSLRQGMGDASYHRFLARFHTDATNEKLRQVYVNAVENWSNRIGQAKHVSPSAP